ncbi:DUF3857 domain-containing transglutaminase family protein [Chthonomonas calidirosea]|uniref:DUF3857 domain-containing transglutaminase family protein n=1 Tax=Chthonomonas calidirosea TaxID=454171 RepID=UPI0006ECBD76|nr:DUF3857 domain-containing protein [Chthonomonas calidirosea]CEK13060.1 transglutaminase-like enzyme, predicted cysteine protease [Chthonomonas calidirosea]
MKWSHVVFVVMGWMVWQQLALAQSPSATKPVIPPTLDATLQEALRTAPDQSRWPNSHYVKLLDLGELTVEPDGTTIGIYRETYKLFDRAARALAEVHLPFNSSFQELTLVSARTIEPDGKVLTVPLNSLRQEGVESDYPLYDDAVAIGFSMPGIQDNCVIDYTYKIVTHPTFFPGLVTAYWGFNDAFPVMLSRYTLHVPASMTNLRIRLHHMEGVKTSETISKDGHTKTLTWQMGPLDPIPIETAMPAIGDVRAWMEISSLPDWQAIGRWFYKLCTPQWQPDDAMRQKVAQLLTGLTSPEARASAIYRWVTDHVRYVGLEFGLSAYKPHAAATVFRNLYGDCKDKVILLITMLRLAGIEAQPALLYAGRLRPLTADLPSLTAFNHCIALASVNGKSVWMDPTAEDCPYGVVPDADQGVQALVVSENGGTLQTVPIGTPEQEGADFLITMVVGANGAATVTEKAILEGETARSVRGTWRDLTEDRRKTFVGQLIQQFGISGEINECTLSEKAPEQDAVGLDCHLQAASVGRDAGNLLLLPAFSVLLNQVDARPYSAPKRVWPIVIEHPSHVSDIVSVTLPKGCRVLHLPASVHIEGPLETYDRKVTLSDDGSRVTISDRFVQRNGEVAVADYGKEQQFWGQVIQALQDTLVVQKP